MHISFRFISFELKYWLMCIFPLPELLYLEIYQSVCYEHFVGKNFYLVSISLALARTFIW